MKTKTLIFLLLTAVLVACSKVPITERKQINLLPESTLVSMSLTQYRDFLKDNPPVSTSDADAQMVKRIGTKISAAVTQYMKQNKMSKRIEGFKWEFNLVKDDAVNAWCMPGGKVVVYTGLLPVTQDETSLALVMGHEIAHAVARHGNERMSQMLAVQLGGIGLDVALSQKSQQTRGLFMTAYGVGATLGAILPYSRLHETEADKMGLIFMAMAGYDPRKAPDFWNRMSKAGGAKLPEILSSHPSDETRQKNLQQFMPTALKYYKPGTASY